MIDYHIHTELCCHAIGKMEDYVEAACGADLSAMGFSDHLPFNETHMKNLSMELEDLEFYLNKIPELEKKYGIKIYKGIEADFYPEKQNEIEDLLNKHEFDYIFGSVHFINGWGFDNPKFLTEWKNYDIDLVYRSYFQNVIEMTKTGLYDIVGHIDLVKKFGYFPKDSFDKEIVEVISAVKEADMIIEVNTSGLRKPVREIYPSEFVLKNAKEYDIPVVLGSDAHKPQDVAGDFDKAKALLKKVGYTRTAVIEKRKIVDWEEI
ncbi:MAG: histidinol-phosphatase HisJ [Candidatus Aureabacteria bacterium]|nr:histidinol-phosphatase HisJ [Candidatus Auribacterota bacterium]